MGVSEVATVDYHTGGEPFRIVARPPVELPGATVADRRVRAMADDAAQGLRRLLCFEPRGHADMYGGFIVPPDDAGAHLGVLFWHKDGFSTACGHGTIALGAWAVDSGLVAAPADGAVDVVVDVPSGRVRATVHRTGGRTLGVDFLSVPSYVLARDVPLTTASFGAVRVTMSFGGAIYAELPAAAVGLSVTPEHLDRLIRLGREVKAALAGTEYARHPSDGRLDGVYGTIITENLDREGRAAGRLHQRNVTVFADGQVDRSPCGSGTAARVATLVDGGHMGAGDVLVHDSIVGSTFTASVAAEVEQDGRPAVVPILRGTAYRTGEHRFVADPHDALVPGFVLR